MRLLLQSTQVAQTHGPDCEIDATIKALSRLNYNRQSLADSLLKYNISIGNTGKACENIEKLRSSSEYCVITGQQLGFMGGPIYTILKAISCLLLAREKRLIPIFWLATEDHDLAEIDHTYVLNSTGDIFKYHLHFSRGGVPVEDLILYPKHIEMFKDFFSDLHLKEFTLPSEGEFYNLAMARILAQLFAGTGLVFFEPYILRENVRNIFEREIEDTENIFTILRQTNSLSNPLTFEQGTNLFMKNRGLRCKIIKNGAQFLVGESSFSESELLKHVQNEVHKFSPNVALRPIVQSALFPVAVYIAGPGELAYLKQIEKYFSYYNLIPPALIPRLTLSFIPQVVQELLKKLDKAPWDYLPTSWLETMPHIEAICNSIKQDWAATLHRLCEDILDPVSAKQHVKEYTNKLQKKLIKAELKKSRMPVYGLHFLHNLVHPHQKNQERVLNWFSFQAHSDINLLFELLQTASWRTQGHIYAYI